MSDTAAFVIVHGWENWRPVGHWQRWLAESLRERGEQVSYEQLPEADLPVLDHWLTVLDKILAEAGDRNVTVVAHSLGVLLWLHHAARATGTAVDRVLLVSPPDPAVLEDALPALDAVVLRRAGHITPQDGFGPWPAILDWCLGRTVSWDYPASE
ncbi:MAG: alpha/beta hydrolase [Actinobacteria bacterium]|nr:alpha/beta hydrolase [Actinomycetota bacterium]